MQKWEYQTLSFSINSGIFGNKDYDPQTQDSHLNQLGEQGWELVSVVSLAAANGWSSQILATLKRPRS